MPVSGRRKGRACSWGYTWRAQGETSLARIWQALLFKTSCSAGKEGRSRCRRGSEWDGRRLTRRDIGGAADRRLSRRKRIAVPSRRVARLHATGSPRELAPADISGLNRQTQHDRRELGRTRLRDRAASVKTRETTTTFRRREMAVAKADQPMKSSRSRTAKTRMRDSAEICVTGIDCLLACATKGSRLDTSFVEEVVVEKTVVGAAGRGWKYRDTRGRRPRTVARCHELKALGPEHRYQKQTFSRFLVVFSIALSR